MLKEKNSKFSYLKKLEYSFETKKIMIIFRFI